MKTNIFMILTVDGSPDSDGVDRVLQALGKDLEGLRVSCGAEAAWIDDVCEELTGS